VWRAGLVFLTWIARLTYQLLTPHRPDVGSAEPCHSRCAGSSSLTTITRNTAKSAMAIDVSRATATAEI
jgi:hypothetical protein